MIEKIIIILVGVFLICVAVFCVTGIIGLFLLLNVNEKYHINIHYPKSKKYENKIDPIYEITNWECHSSYYTIQKWSLKWYESLNVSFLFIVLMYPVHILFWGYQEDGQIYIGEKPDVEKLYEKLKSENITLREYFEIEKEKERVREKEISDKQKVFENSVKELNKEFDENYVTKLNKEFNENFIK